MFWWLEPCQGCHGLSIYEEPLVIWLQGGPGASSTGFGNFEEIGPYAQGWKARSHSWVEQANVLFLDNPVGTGFSYVEEGSNFTTTNAELAADLLVWLKEFVWGHPEFHFAPIHIFCESYGGKMGIEFAKAIAHEQATAFLPVNFRGIALGDSWISPIDFVLSWGPYLEALSLLDQQTLTNLSHMAETAQDAMRAGNFSRATDVWGQYEEEIERQTDNVNFYNVLLHNVPDDDVQSSHPVSQSMPGESVPLLARRMLARHHPESLTKWMNREVRDMLGIIPEHVKWGGQARNVSEHLAEDFMKDVISVVDDVLNAGVPVTIYNGQLDLICCTLGVDAWLTQLKWSGSAAFNAAKRRPLYAHRHSKATGAFFKAHANLAMYYIMGAGHMIPSDQPKMALQMLTHILEAPAFEPGNRAKAADLATSSQYQQYLSSHVGSLEAPAFEPGQMQDQSMDMSKQAASSQYQQYLNSHSRPDGDPDSSGSSMQGTVTLSLTTEQAAGSQGAFANSES
ncbi:hypothetical protein WJX72_005120 [[Myrmecia] bisecta]|uniref:Retinoid-inducible serine carboxypeptidase n=1 Tax=[Myrmecia] bisecta TaxID=41462 RepID=A0AAW1QRI5_9CHLO